MKIVSQFFRANAFSTGLAMFAMFFGSGNLIFPVGVGQVAGDQNTYAVLGLFCTAVFLPFATLTLMLILKGDYNHFFQAMGRLPGKLIAFLIIILLGPVGVLPRCIAFSYSTWSLYDEHLSLFAYSLLACLLVFVLAYKRGRVVGIIGNILTPVLLISLAFLIVKGLLATSGATEATTGLSPASAFGLGFMEGYKTMDIFAALFFATAIIPAFQSVLGDGLGESKKKLYFLAIRSSLVGMALLFIVYAGMSFVAANLRGELGGVSGDKLLGTMAALTLGPEAGLFANLVVSLSCITTAISLAVVSSEFIRKEIFSHRIGYGPVLLLTMVISFFFALRGFSGIMQFIVPILEVLCPAVLVLICANAAKHFYGFRYVKLPVYATLGGSLLLKLLS